MEAYLSLFAAAFLAATLVPAYSEILFAGLLAAGGPLVEPHMEAIVLTPMCPHSLADRPLVLPADSRIVLTLDSDGVEAGCTVDGQHHLGVQRGDRVEIRRAKRGALIQGLGEHDWFTVLRERLHWRPPGSPRRG